MDNKILFEETFKTFDEKRRTRFLSCDDPEAWAEDDVTTLMYDVAITARDAVLNELLKQLKSSLTDEQLKPVLDVIPELFSKDTTKVESGIDKETIKRVVSLYRQWGDELSDTPFTEYIQKRLAPATEPQKKIRCRRIYDCHISIRAINCLYLNNIWTTDDLLYGNFDIQRFKQTRGAGIVTVKEVEDLITALKKEEEQL